MLALAYQIGLTPDQFWAMNAREFAAVHEGWRRRESADMRKRAWEVCYIIAPWSKARLRPSDLWSEEPAQPERVITTAEEFHAEAARVEAAIKARKAREIAELRARRRGRIRRSKC